MGKKLEQTLYRGGTKWLVNINKDEISFINKGNKNWKPKQNTITHPADY